MLKDHQHHQIPAYVREHETVVAPTSTVGVIFFISVEQPQYRAGHSASKW